MERKGLMIHCCLPLNEGNNECGIYGRLKIVTPRITAIATNTKKKKKMNLAIDAAPDAISVKPKTAAIIAITKKIAAHFNIVVVFIFVWMFSFYGLCLLSL